MNLRLAVAWLAISAVIAGCGGGSPEGDSNTTAGGTSQNQPTTATGGTPQNQPTQAWAGATLIEHDDQGNMLSVEPKVVIDAAGNSNVVWIQQFPNTPQVMSNRFSVTSGWGTPAVMNSTAYASRPQIANDGNGGAIAIWDQMLDGIWSSRLSAGADWGTPEVVGAPNSLGALYPRVAFANDGTALAVWQQGDGSRINIWSNRRTVAGWGTPTLAETSDAAYAEEPALAVDSGGAAIVLWRQRQASNTAAELWANYYTPGAGWGTPQAIGTDVSAVSYQVAFDGHGNAMAVWADFTTSWANRYTAGQGWGTPFPLGPASSPRVAFDEQGNALVLWIQQDTVPNPFPCVVPASLGGSGSCPATIVRVNLRSRLYTPAGGWGQPQLVDTDDLGDVSSPAFAFDQAGNAVAVWTQRVPSLFSSVVTVWANRYTKGTGWSTATVIQDQATGDAMYPSIAVNASGEAVVVWGQSDGSRANVWATRLH